MSVSANVPRSTVLALIVCGLAIGLSACDNKNKNISDLPDPLPGPVVRAAPANRGEQQREELNQAATDLQAGFDEMNTRGAKKPGDHGDQLEPETPPKFQSQKPRNAPDSGASRGLRDLGANRAASVPEAAPSTTVATNGKSKSSSKDRAERTLDQRRADAVADLGVVLKPDIAGAREPMRAAMPLIALETISPGAGNNDLDAISRAISPDQRRTVGVARDLVRAFATDPSLIAADPASMAQTLRAQADLLSSAAKTDGLALGTVALCQRVDGFGRFTPLSGTTILAGRPAAMIVYTEVENFSQAPPATGEAPRSGGLGGDGESWRVELAQTVRLYYDADGSEQLVFPEALARDASRSKRHDFFLVQRIDLPRNLSVGNYNLKVSVRDVASGAIAEHTLPIKVVADGSAAASPQRAESRPRPAGQAVGQK